MNEIKLVTHELWGERLISTQYDKVFEEYMEMAVEIFRTKDNHNALIECMDLITATLNLMNMLGTPEEVAKANDEWFNKMVNYEFAKKYTISKVLTLKEYEFEWRGKGEGE
jgi:hypothetical protein